MNKTRRKAIEEVIKRLNDVQAEMEAILEDVDGLKDEEQEYLDNMPENLQGSDRYSAAEEAVGNLEAARDTLEELKDQIDDVTGGLEEAQA